MYASRRGDAKSRDGLVLKWDEVEVEVEGAGRVGSGYTEIGTGPGAVGREFGQWHNRSLLHCEHQETQHRNMLYMARKWERGRQAEEGLIGFGPMHWARSVWGRPRASDAHGATGSGGVLYTEGYARNYLVVVLR